jgi:hypothetical protein
VSEPVELVTGFTLPFELHLSRDAPFSSGRTIYLSFVGPDRPSEPELRAVIERFARLAETGALGSSRVPPESSTVGKRSVTATEAAIERCRVDERAAIVLAHLLLARQDRLALRSVTVRTANQQVFRSPRQVPGQASRYPDHPRATPFQLVEERPAGAVGATFVAELARPIGPAEADPLAAALAAWADATAGGAYAAAPLPPDRCAAVAQAPVHAGTRLEYTVAELRAAPEAVNGVINILTAFHHGLCPLVSLRVS